MSTIQYCTVMSTIDLMSTIHLCCPGMLQAFTATLTSMTVTPTPVRTQPPVWTGSMTTHAAALPSGWGRTAARYTTLAPSYSRARTMPPAAQRRRSRSTAAPASPASLAETARPTLMTVSVTPARLLSSATMESTPTPVPVP